MQVVAALQELEATGNYLFHGTSIDNIQLFEPRQALSHGEKDGAPCVAASSYVDPALFMALFSNRASCGWNAHGLNFGFYVKKPDYDKAKAEGWRGFVYVFDRSLFKRYRGWEWRAYTQVKPLKKLSVVFSDLPGQVELT